MNGLFAVARVPGRVRPLLLAVGLAMALSSPAQADDAAPVPPASALDAPLFYQLLIGEMELRAGRAGSAYEVILDAARRQGDDALYQRAVEIALQARAGDQALEAARAWRQRKPQAVPPLRYEIQILLALKRVDEAVESIAQLLKIAPDAERAGLIASVPRLLQQLPEPPRALALTEQLIRPYEQSADTRTAARLALARMQLAAGQGALALEGALAAEKDDPAAPGPALLGLELMASQVAAEGLVSRYLARTDAEPAVRMAYVRQLMRGQRYAESGTQLERLTLDRPQLPEPWLMLGALRVELKEPQAAESALQKFVDLVRSTQPALPAGASDSADEDADDNDGGSPRTDLTQAWLLLAQAAEQRGDGAAAERWLAQVDNPQKALEVQTRRAALLAKKGQVKEARALIQAMPERTGDDARAKALAEAQVLRDVKRWREAGEVLTSASARQPDDTELLYELAMVDEKLERFADMERRLRRVIELKQDHPHAHNALGYSLAERNVRLPEAKALIERALALAPGDPFITDSLGWVEHRMGRREEALRLLRQAFAARPDTEIAAHLGEVLWAAGQQDEARRVWQEGRQRDPSNEVLLETLKRLKVKL